MPHITVINPGLCTTIQDQGRTGFMSSGFSPSGVMDRRAFNLANILVGNPMDTPVLEFALSGPTLTFQEDTVCALTGAYFNATLDGNPVASYRAFLAPARSQLALPVASKGVYGYLAVSGGFVGDEVMGSASTNLKCAIGGYQGRALQAGDELETAQGSFPPEVLSLGNPYRNDPYYQFDYSVREIRVIPGPQAEQFDSHSLHRFYSSDYTVTPQSDRMGYRLSGPAVAGPKGSDIISDGIAFGSIQVPSQGTPIIMLADRQTTGGYAKIATVASVDIPLLVQRRPGQKVRFTAVSVPVAQDLYKIQKAYLEHVQSIVEERIRHAAQ